MSPRDAIMQASLLRFRPIMMTTLAALFGALPRGLQDGVARRHAVMALGLEREVDRSDGVLLHDAHQQHDADQRDHRQSEATTTWSSPELSSVPSSPGCRPACLR